MSLTISMTVNDFKGEQLLKSLDYVLSVIVEAKQSHLSVDDNNISITIKYGVQIKLLSDVYHT